MYKLLTNFTVKLFLYIKVNYSIMAVVIDTYADEDRMKEDVNQVGTTDTEILNLITRSNEDASSRLNAIFLDNVDFNDLPGWFVDLATRLAVKIYWDKSNGTPESSEKIKEIVEESKQILIKRFFPVTFRS